MSDDFNPLERKIKKISGREDLSGPSIRELIKTQDFKFEWQEDERNLLDRINRKVEDLTAERNQIITELVEAIKEELERSNIEGVILESTIYELAIQAKKIEEEAVQAHLDYKFAQQIYDDEFWEAYRHIVDGTREDKTAYAMSKTIQSRYYAFFQYYVMKKLQTQLEQVKSIQRLLENTIARESRRAVNY